MVFATPAPQAMTSTFRGMRRILKTQYSTPEYIRRAVESGVYRTQEEIRQVRKDRRESNEDLAVIMRRFRQDIVRGSYIHDYPIEYMILMQNPPLPDPLRTPKKYQKQNDQHELQKYVKRYLQRYETDTGSSRNDSGAPETSEEYYRRLLGVPAPRKDQAMGQKPASLQKAYAAAVKHYQLIRTEGMSEHEALSKVEELLKEQDVKEQEQSHRRVRELKEASSKQSTTKNEASDKKETKPVEDLIKNVWYSDPRVVEAMMIWSERLQAVPYEQWTVGASVALDHWIARQMLGLSEETWEALLDGEDPDLLARGRDIVAVRETVFPETRMELPAEEPTDEDEDVHAEEKSNSEDEEKSIEELLALLGVEDEAESTKSTADIPERSLDKLVNQLQGWRAKNQAKQFDEWNDSEQHEFKQWMKSYVETLMPEVARASIDFDSTREALLSQPPMTKEASDSFWDALENERDAVKLLDAMRKDGAPAGASVLESAFWDLPYEQQLERLLNLGALRPILDEYATQESRLAFLQRYSQALLNGVELEHLVEDPNGPILAENVDPSLPKDLRLRLVLLPYQSSGDLSALQKSRSMYKAWNYVKAGRARHEEHLFHMGRLGLQYNEGKGKGNK